MIPETLLSLVLFAATVGPGYVFVRVAERREPRPNRSQLFEAAELVLVGGAATAFSAVAVALLYQVTGWLDLRDFADRPADYTIDKPFAVLTMLLLIMLLSYVLAYVAARIIYRGAKPSLQLQSPVLRELVKKCETSGATFATVRLRDGQAFDGYVSGYTLERDDGGRDLALEAPIFMRLQPREERRLVNADYAIIAETDVVYVLLQKDTRHKRTP